MSTRSARAPVSPLQVVNEAPCSRGGAASPAASSPAAKREAAWPQRLADQNASPQENVQQPQRAAKRKDGGSPLRQSRKLPASTLRRSAPSSSPAAVLAGSAGTQPLPSPEPAMADAQPPGARGGCPALLELQNFLFQPAQHSDNTEAAEAAADSPPPLATAAAEPFALRWTQEGIRAARNALFEPHAIAEAADMATPPKLGLLGSGAKRRTPLSGLGREAAAAAATRPLPAPPSLLQSLKLNLMYDEESASPASEEGPTGPQWRASNPTFDASGQEQDSEAAASLRAKYGSPAVLGSPAGLPEPSPASQPAASPAEDAELAYGICEVGEPQPRLNRRNAFEGRVPPTPRPSYGGIEEAPARAHAAQQAPKAAAADPTSRGGGWLASCFCLAPQSATKE